MNGVYVNDIQNNPLQPDINYRGYTASPLLGTPQGLSVYLDGMRLNQPFGDVVSWDLIPRAALESLTLLPGSNPLFGLNTLGAALELRTKDGYTSPGSSVQTAYGSNGRLGLEVQTGNHTENGFHWYATANRLTDDGWRDASPTEAAQLFGKVGWRHGANDVSLTAAYADTDLTGNGLQEQRFLAARLRERLHEAGQHAEPLGLAEPRGCATSSAIDSRFRATRTTARSEARR